MKKIVMIGILILIFYFVMINKTADNDLNSLLTLNGADQLASYNIYPSGNIITDFAALTDAQGGGKSKDTSDLGNAVLPPSPDIDGNYYGTVRDITYVLYHAYFPNDDSNSFYNMTDDKKNFIISSFLSSAIETSSDAVNAFLAYIKWASGSYMIEKSLYQSKYGTTLNADVQIDEIDTLKKLALIRIDRIKTFTQYPIYGLGWTRGILNAWKLFLNYCK